MKLKIKLPNSRTLGIDIEETKTVNELKKQLSLHSDVAENPELQQISYDGKILDDNEKLCAYKIDIKNCLTITIIEQPPNGATAQQALNAAEKQPVTPEKDKNLKEQKMKELATMDSAIVANKRGEMIANLIGLGYPEDDVRRALADSCYNPKRALEYLMADIPTSPSTTESEYYSDSDGDVTMPMCEWFRSEPSFKRLRFDLLQPVDTLNTAVERMGATDPSLLEVINENPHDFLNLLFEDSDYENDENENEGKQQYGDDEIKDANADGN